MLVFHASPNTAHIPQRIPVSAFPLRQPGQSLPHRIHASVPCIPSIQRHLLFLPPAPAAPLSHTEHPHVHLRAGTELGPISQNLHQGSVVVSNPPLWFALSHSGACSTSRCSSTAAAVPEKPHDREVVDGHLLYSKPEHGWQKLLPTSKQQKVLIIPLTAKELGRAEPRCSSWEPQEPHVRPELTRVAQRQLWFLPGSAAVEPSSSFCRWDNSKLVISQLRKRQEPKDAASEGTME